VRSLFLVSLVVNLIVLIPTNIENTGNALPDISSGLSDPGSAYGNSADTRLERTTPMAYVRIGLAPILVLLMPLTIFYWRRWAVGLRAVAIGAILFVVAADVGRGTNKAFADAALLMPSIALAAWMSQGSLGSRKRVALFAAAVVVGLGGFFAFFSATSGSRAGGFAQYGYFRATGTFADYNYPLIRDLPPDAQVGALGLSGYLTQGYYALYLSLQKPFVPMFGVGNSLFLQRQAARITDDPTILREAYPFRIEVDGWDGLGLWATIYPWIASDVSFLGSLVVVFLIGRFFALAWLDTLGVSNPFAVVVFALFLAMLFYFPANNQMLQDGEGVTAFWTTFIAWLVTRKSDL